MSSVVWRKKKKKKLATVIVGLFSLKENAPTKKTLLTRRRPKVEWCPEKYPEWNAGNNPKPNAKKDTESEREEREMGVLDESDFEMDNPYTSERDGYKSIATKHENGWNSMPTAK